MKNGNSLRVALVASFLPPYRISLYNQINTHPQIDLDVLLCSLKEKDRSWNLETGGVEFPYSVYWGLNIPLRFSPSRSDFYHIHFNGILLARLIREDYDAVILSGYTSLTHQAVYWLAKIKRLPVILWYRSHSASGSVVRKAVTPYIDTLIRRSDALVVPGEKSKQYLLERGAGPGSIFPVGNTIDNQGYLQVYRRYSKIGRTELSQKLDLVDKKILLFVGRLVDVKGLFDLLDAFIIVNNRVANATLLIVGDGYLEAKLWDYCRENNIASVKFAGFIQPSELGEIYLCADVFVLPSHYETWGLVLNEAMIYGLPVVTTSSVGAAGEIVQNGKTGFVVPPRDPEQLADAIVRIFSDEALAISMGENAQALIAEHTPERSAQGFVEAIEYAIK